MTAKRPPRLSDDDLDVIQLALISIIREDTSAAANPTVSPEWKAWYERNVALAAHADRVVREIRFARGDAMHEANPLPPAKALFATAVA